MIEVVEDVLEAGGLRRMRWASDEEFADPPFDGPFDCAGEDAPLRSGWRMWEDAVLGLQYVELAWQYRGPVEIKFEEWPRMRRMLAWSIRPSMGPSTALPDGRSALGEVRVSEAMREGAQEYARLCGRWPGVACIHKAPKGVPQDGVEVEGVLLVECEWTLPGFLFIGG